MSKFTHADVQTIARFAGSIKRYHTWPVLHNQTTGEHTWQVFRIYWQIFGPMPEEVSTFILWHDAGELVTGDTPGMLKTAVPEIKQLLDRAERLAIDEMGGSVELGVSAPTKIRVKACDLIDVYEHCSVELLQGNRLVEGGITWAQEQLGIVISCMSPGDDDKVKNYMRKHKAWCNR
jgi:5'-deoxynucleotidase YfbR-like HD superfamily hydrolase